MGKYEKLLAQWRVHIPPTVSKDDVFGLAKRFGLNVEEKGGSHAIIRDARLKAFSAQGHEPDVFADALTIPSVGGRQVKRRYVKNLVNFIVYLIDSEACGHEEEDEDS